MNPAAVRDTLFVVAVLAVCAAAGRALAPRDGGEGDVQEASDASASSLPPCDEGDAVLYFHGRSRLGLEVVGPGICAPRLVDEGEPGFWSDDAARIGAPSARVLVGYSAGRIPVLRRLKAGASGEEVAALLDPSWSDGARFDGMTGVEIVARWLAGDERRSFAMVYAPDAAGYREYAALREGPAGRRIHLCAIAATHDAIPRIVGTAFLRDPVAWVARTCPNGALAMPDASSPESPPVEEAPSEDDTAPAAPSEPVPSPADEPDAATSSP